MKGSTVIKIIVMSLSVFLLIKGLIYLYKWNIDVFILSCALIGLFDIFRTIASLILNEEKCKPHYFISVTYPICFFIIYIIPEGWGKLMNWADKNISDKNT